MTDLVVRFEIDCDHVDHLCVTAIDHNLEHCSGPYVVSGEALPFGLDGAMLVFVIALGRRVFRLAASRYNASRGNAVVLLTSGRGPFDLTPYEGPSR